jgi:hypothetical protein
MEYVNSIVNRCVVLEEYLCLQSAGELLVLVDETIKLLMGRSRILPDRRLDLTCLMCGKGKYKPQEDHLHESLYFNLPLHNPHNQLSSAARLRIFVCDVCTNYAFFAIGYPEDVEKRGWPSKGADPK